MLLRTARVSGLISAVGGLALYVAFVWFNPYTPGELTWPVVARLVVGVLGVFAAYKVRPTLMMLVFVVSFVPLGLYMLGTPGLFRWIGIFDLVYLVASVLVIINGLKSKSLTRAKQS